MLFFTTWPRQSVVFYITKLSKITLKINMLTDFIHAAMNNPYEPVRTVLIKFLKIVIDFKVMHNPMCMHTDNAVR